MINLISQEVKKEVATQYFLRLGTVSLLIIAAFLFLGFVLLIPSYFVANEREATEHIRAEDLRSTQAFQENKELGAFVDSTKKQLRIVNRVPSIVISEQFVQPVLDHVYADTSSVKLDHINYTDTDGVGLINIRGTADARDDLLTFIETLKQDELFSKVEVPVSSFVQNTDINFHAILHITDEEV